MFVFGDKADIEAAPLEIACRQIIPTTAQITRLSRVLGSWGFEIVTSATALFLAPLPPHHQYSKRNGDGEHRITREKNLVGVSHLATADFGYSCNAVSASLL
jgi:hypothetical protein